MFGLIKIRGAPEDQHAVVGQFMHHTPQFAARDRIDAHPRLIQQQHLGLAYQRTGQPQLLLHAAGKLAGQAIGKVSEIGKFQQLLEGSLARFAGDAAQIGIQRQVFHHRQVFIQAEFLRHIAKNGVQLTILGDRIQSGDAQLAAAGFQQPGQHAQQRGFARAVRPDQAGHRTAA